MSTTAAPLPVQIPASHSSRVRKQRLWQIGRTLLAAAIAIFFMLPIIWWALASIKPMQEIIAAPPKLWGFTPTMNWYKVVLFNVDPDTFNLQQTGAVGRGSGGGTFYSIPYLKSSFFIGLCATFFTLLVATPAAYALSRFRLSRRKDLAFWVLSQRMMPPIVVAFPLFFMYRKFHLIDTYPGLILIYTVINLPLAVLLLMSFFDEVPADIDDAAQVDGASRWQAFHQIILHYVGGGLAATAVLTFIFCWNEFLLALVLTTGKIRTVPVASSTFTTSFATEWGYLAALGTASMVPIFVFILLVQRHLVRGLTLGAVK